MPSSALGNLLKGAVPCALANQKRPKLWVDPFFEAGSLVINVGGGFRQTGVGSPRHRGQRAAVAIPVGRRNPVGVRLADFPSERIIIEISPVPDPVFGGRQVQNRRADLNIKIRRRRAVRIRHSGQSMQAIPEFCHRHVPLVTERCHIARGIPGIAVGPEKGINRGLEAVVAVEGVGNLLKYAFPSALGRPESSEAMV